VTGSDTRANVLFGGIAQVAAEQLGLSPNLMGAATVPGADGQDDSTRSPSSSPPPPTRWFDHEGDILGYVFFHSIALACLVGIFVRLAGYVWPFSALVIK